MAVTLTDGTTTVTLTDLTIDSTRTRRARHLRHVNLDGSVVLSLRPAEADTTGSLVLVAADRATALAAQQLLEGDVVWTLTRTADASWTFAGVLAPDSTVTVSMTSALTWRVGADVVEVTP
ncbi:MAG: hypothetical protein FWF90_15630 [Promicromonosporaceae bacterium]|nr:hypothetical protein [Promicromonosporaceae bacterium]